MIINIITGQNGGILFNDNEYNYGTNEVDSQRNLGTMVRFLKAVLGPIFLCFVGPSVGCDATNRLSIEQRRMLRSVLLMQI